ncbi:Zn-dependent hydrolase [Halosquirtibacter laminarini]|uniref:Zn-dependent hydrolase n=1 Tax=Halosquirtibacter laminarini TaxID=3374600 RepID=A0AC61NDF9_9BACT|nr:Zn-dependent hydrolase [Prolixibacteraceae bacterium]
MNFLKTLLYCIPLFFACSQKKIEYRCNETPKSLVAQYTNIDLNTDLSGYNKSDKKMIKALIKVSDIMDDLYWRQSWGSKQVLFDHVKDEDLNKMIAINYGPWNKLNEDKSFIVGIGEKSLGAEFYPKDMTKSEFDELNISNKSSHYTIIRRDSNQILNVVPYHIAYNIELTKASKLINEAAQYAKDPTFKKYLLERAKALTNDKYYNSDLTWMDLKNNDIDFIVGAIERYEDRLYGMKYSYQAMLMKRDKKWSNKLDKIIHMLPELQASLPVAPEYKSEIPSSNSQLDVFDLLYAKGDANGPDKTIAINLPNDINIQKKKGCRNIQLKNIIKAKFNKVMLPITRVLIDNNQQKYVTFDAFFENTMFLEIGHSMGMKRTVHNKNKVIDCLKEQYSVIEMGKADIVGLYLIDQVNKQNIEIIQNDIKENYVTIMTSIFRALRFGTSNTGGRANIIKYNYFCQKGAFEKNMITGRYHVNFKKMQKAIVDLSKLYLTIQGDGDYDRAKDFIDNYAIIPADLQADLKKLEKVNIPKDIQYKQGLDELSL